MKLRGREQCQIQSSEVKSLCAKEEAWPRCFGGAFAIPEYEMSELDQRDLSRSRGDSGVSRLFAQMFARKGQVVVNSEL